MLDWKANLDALVKETMAFAESVRVERMMLGTVLETNRVPPANSTGSEREEITRRVANFRAHQERFMREREDYAASEFRRMRPSR